MNKSTRLIITTAAMAGLYAGTLAVKSYAADDKAGQPAQKDDSKAKGCGAHGCKGKNGCSGKGGCSAGDNGCKGKNSCKGKGGCEVKDTAPKK